MPRVSREKFPGRRKGIHTPLANLTLRAALRPILEHRERYNQRDKFNKKRQAVIFEAANTRLIQSEILNWFPGINWDFVERKRKLEIWKTGNDESEQNNVYLSIHTKKNTIYLVEQQTHTESKSGLHKQYQVWTGQEVSSAEEVLNLVGEERSYYLMRPK